MTPQVLGEQFSRPDAAAAAPATVHAATRAGMPSGPPGVDLRVSGTGYRACSNVYVFFDGTRLGTAHPDATGAIPHSDVVVPGDVSPGRHIVETSCYSSGRPVLRTTTFMVTPASIHRSPISTAVPTPNQISFSPKSIAVSTAGALGLLFLIAFPSELFNSTLEEHYDEVRGWFPRRRVRPRPGGASKKGRDAPVSAAERGIKFGLFLVAGGILYALLSPSFGLNWSSVANVLGLTLSLIVVTIGFALPGMVYMRRRFHDSGYIEILPGTVLLAAACVLVSRAIHFQPGYLYGLIAGVAFRRELTKRAEGRLTAVSAAFVLVVSVVAWIVRVPIAHAASNGHPGFWLVVADAGLSSVFLLGLDSLVISLLPLRFLEGSKLRSWSKAGWATLFGVTLFAFVHLLLRPDSGYVANTRISPTGLVVGLFIAFGALSVVFWGYFRFRPARVGAEVPAEPREFDLTGRL
ncbi:MAG: hypothetical protein JO367_12875 [Actinobacteria bacterium]|nr:hypothetical protein [Actinomycetota bacterium]